MYYDPFLVAAAQSQAAQMQAQAQAQAAAAQQVDQNSYRLQVNNRSDSILYHHNSGLLVSCGHC